MSVAAISLSSTWSYGQDVFRDRASETGNKSPEVSILAPIVVTATKVEQSGIDLPVSINLLDRNVIQHSGATMINLSEPLARVPGVVAHNRQNYAQDLQISSRGFGARSTFGVRGVRLYADGIPATMPDGQGQTSNFDLASADHIEVLRGPFSALYGNSSGGVISVFTEDGKPGSQLSPFVRFGSFDTTLYGTKLLGQQGRANYVVDATRFDIGGYREHSAASRDTENIKLRLTPDDDSLVTIIGNAVSMPNVQDPLGLTRSQFEQNSRSADPSALVFNTRKSVRQQQLGLNYERFINSEDSVHVVGYGGHRTTVQYQAIPVSAQMPATSAGGVIDLSRRYGGLDLRWNHGQISNMKSFQWTAGISIDSLNESRRGYENFVGNELGVKGNLRRDERNEVYNVDEYFQVQWKPHERWLLLAGLRNSNIHVDSDDRYIMPGNGDDSGGTRYHAFTPVIGATFNVSSTTHAYVSYGEGFETPTLNELSYRSADVGGSGFNFALQPSKSDNVEAGIKTQAGQHTHINLAVFHIETENELTVLSNTGGRAVYRNAGKTQRDGMELEWGGKWNNNVGALLSYSLLRAVYVDAFCPAICTSSAQVRSGNRIPGVPSKAAYAELSWHDASSGFSAALEGKYAGKIYVDDVNSDSAPAYVIANIRMGLEQRRGHWQFREFLRIENIADRTYIGSVIVNESNRRFFEPAPGRNYLAGVNAVYAWQ